MINHLPVELESDKNIVQAFARTNVVEIPALRRLVNYHLEKLNDLSQIDFNKNVGLQACANNRAHDILQEILEDLELIDSPTNKVKSKGYK